MIKTDIHPIQGDILCKLLFTKDSGFAELNTKKIPSDQFSFHLKQLTDWKYIEKNDLGRYRLTTKGKEFANRFDTDNKEVERQPKLGVLVIAIKKINNVKHYLIQQRLKQPYYGFWGFITGKIKWGETIEEGASRELFEETGISGVTKLVGIKHKMDYNDTGVLLEDKYFMVVKVIKTTAELQSEFEGGKNQWMTREEIMKLPDLFDGVEESIQMTENNKLEISETKYRVKKY